MSNRTEDPNLQVGECSCSRCQSACRHRPGFFRPEQIKPLAKALKISTKKLFEEHLAVDFWGGDPDIFLLSPRLSHERGGDMAPADPRGTCHWFKDGKCAIHTKGKPAECAGLGHVEGKDVMADRKAIVESWKPHQEWIRKLYGSELIAPEVSFSDMFGMFSGFGLGVFCDD